MHSYGRKYSHRVSLLPLLHLSLSFSISLSPSLSLFPSLSLCSLRGEEKSRDEREVKHTFEGHENDGEEDEG